MKRGGPTHPKTYDLAERLGVQWAHAVGILEVLFHFGAQYAPEGNVGRFSDKRIAAGLGWRGQPSKLVSALVVSGWLDEHPTERLVIHDWADHLDQGVTRKLERAGKKPFQSNHNGTGKTTSHDVPAVASLPLPVPLPLPEPLPQTPCAATPLVLSPPPIQQPLKEKKHRQHVGIEDIRKRLGPIRLQWCIEFWEIYPCHDGKLECWTAFEDTVNTPELWEKVKAGAIRYAEKVKADPTTRLKYGQGWIHSERWEDGKDRPDLASLPAGRSAKDYLAEQDRLQAEAERE